MDWIKAALLTGILKRSVDEHGSRRYCGRPADEATAAGVATD